MKKFLIIFLIIIGLVGVGIGLYLRQNTGLEVADVLPDNVLLYAGVNNIDDAFKQIEASGVLEKLEKVDLASLFPQNPALKQQLDAILKQSSEKKGEKFLLSKIFGKEIVLAVYTRNVNLQKLLNFSLINASSITEELLSNVVIASRISKEMQVTDAFIKSFNSVKIKYATDSFEYEKIDVNVLSLTDLGVELCFTRIKDLVVFSFGRESARKIIDVYTKKTRSLSLDPQFAKAKNNFVENYNLCSYWDVEKTRRGLKRVADWLWAEADKQALGNVPFLANFSKEQIAGLKIQLENIFDRMKGVKSFSSSTGIKDISQVRVDLAFNKDEMTPLMSQFYSSENKENETINFIPKEALFYSWSGSLDLNLYWQQIKAQLEDALKIQGAGGTVEGEIKGLEDKIGFKIEEDLLPAVGNEIGGYLGEIKMMLFPIPKIVLFLKINNVEKAKGLIEKFTTNPYLSAQNKDYSGYKITYFTLPIGVDIQPGYSFMDNYLLIALDSKSIENSIDIKNNKQSSLLDNEQFKELNLGLTGKSQSVTFTRLSDVLSKLRGIIEFGLAQYEAQNMKASSFMSGQEKLLNDKRLETSKYREDASNLQLKKGALEKEVSDLAATGVNTDEKNKEIAKLNEDLSGLSVKINDSLAREDEIQKSLIGFRNSSIAASQSKEFSSKVLYPILDVFETIDAMGAKTWSDDGLFTTEIFIKGKTQNKEKK